MGNNSEQLDKVKRIKFFEEVILAGGGKKGIDGKIILKSLKNKKHLTVKFTKDYIDIHETEEGKIKKYKPIVNIGIGDFIENLKPKFESFIECLKIEFPKYRVNIDDPKYKNYIAFIQRDKGVLTNKLFRKKGRTLELPKEILKDSKWLCDIYIPLRLPEVKEYIFNWAKVFNPSEKLWLILFRSNDNYFLIEDEILEEWLNELSPF